MRRRRLRCEATRRSCPPTNADWSRAPPSSIAAFLSASETVASWLVCRSWLAGSTGSRDGARALAWVSLRHKASLDARYAGTRTDYSAADDARVTRPMRRTVVEWLFELWVEFYQCSGEARAFEDDGDDGTTVESRSHHSTAGGPLECWFLAVRLLDDACRRLAPSAGRLQAIACSCFAIAYKHSDHKFGCRGAVAFLSKMTDGAADPGGIRALETLALKTFDWSVHTRATLYDYFVVLNLLFSVESREHRSVIWTIGAEWYLGETGACLTRDPLLVAVAVWHHCYCIVHCLPRSAWQFRWLGWSSQDVESCLRLSEVDVTAVARLGCRRLLLDWVRGTGSDDEALDWTDGGRSATVSYSDLLLRSFSRGTFRGATGKAVCGAIKRSPEAETR